MKIASLGLAMLLAATALAQPLQPVYPPLSGDTFLESRLMLEGNFARSANGVAPLEVDLGLTLAARQHAAEMARLGYFSHASPLPENATLRHRLVRAGSPLVTIGENLAMLQGQPDLAVAAVEGWLESPGHRANLLSDRFTHVGYGTAVDDRGATVIVQTLAYKPATLERSAVAPRLLSVRTLTLTVWSEGGGSALFSLSGAGDLVTDLRRGLQEIPFRTATELSGLVQLRAGVALDSGSFILQDAGWIDSEGGGWSPDPSTIRDTLSIEGVSIARSERPGAELSLTYVQPPGARIAVFVGDDQRRGAVTASGVELVLEAGDFGAPVQVGVIVGGRVDIFHSFTVVDRAGVPSLLPTEP
jgi:uncharacterized protein YkwD